MTSKSSKKSRILLLMCEGGGGRKSAADSLNEILGCTYDVEVVNVLNSILHSIDPIKVASCGKFGGEDCYNFFIQRDYCRLLKFFVMAGKSYVHSQQDKIAQLFEKYLSTQNSLPDLIISTVPFMNSGLLKAAHSLKIPYFLVATDLDTTSYLQGFDKIDPELLERFKMSVAYERPEIVLQIFKHSQLEPQDLTFSGFPIRPACQHQYSPEELAALKTSFGMSLRRKIITLVMGAEGNTTIFEHTKVIAKLSPSICGNPLEANICVGRNRKIQKKIVHWLDREGGWLIHKNKDRISVLMPQGTILHIREFTDQLIPIMACSDLIITKTGSSTVNEAIYLGKKILLDNSLLSTARHLWWEQFNVHFVKRHGLGSIFTHSTELASLIPFLINHVKLPAKSLRLPDFQTNITDFVSSIFEPTQ